MGRWLLGFLLLASSLACCAPASTAADNTAVRALATQQAEAWNRHDAKAYAELFSADCDVVNVAGLWWSGRVELQRKLAAAYSTMFKNSALTFTDVQVRFLTPQIAIAHMRWTMTGATTMPGIPQPKQGIQTLILRKLAGKWLIDVFQNTNATAGD